MFTVYHCDWAQVFLYSSDCRGFTVIIQCFIGSSNCDNSDFTDTENELKD